MFDCCSNTVDVLFIDFGDSETDVANSRVRKLPFELKNAPVLGMQVTVLGNFRVILVYFNLNLYNLEQVPLRRVRKWLLRCARCCSLET